MPDPQTSFRRRPDARPGELLAAALSVFAARGFAAARLEDIARQAGVSKGTIYLYFPNKEALFKAAIEAAITPAVEAAEALSSDASRPATERLRAFIFGWWQCVGSSPLAAVPKILVAEAGNFPEVAQWFHDNIVIRAQRAMARLIESGIARGEFRQVEPLLAARIVFAPMFSYLVWRHTFATLACELPEPERFFALATDLLVHGLVQEDRNA